MPPQLRTSPRRFTSITTEKHSRPTPANTCLRASIFNLTDTNLHLTLSLVNTSALELKTTDTISPIQLTRSWTNDSVSSALLVPQSFHLRTVCEQTNNTASCVDDILSTPPMDSQSSIEDTTSGVHSQPLTTVTVPPVESQGSIVEIQFSSQHTDEPAPTPRKTAETLSVIDTCNSSRAISSPATALTFQPNTEDSSTIVEPQEIEAHKVLSRRPHSILLAAKSTDKMIDLHQLAEASELQEGTKATVADVSTYSAGKMLSARDTQSRKPENVTATESRDAVDVSPLTVEAETSVKEIETSIDTIHAKQTSHNPKGGTAGATTQDEISKYKARAYLLEKAYEQAREEYNKLTDDFQKSLASAEAQYQQLMEERRLRHAAQQQEELTVVALVNVTSQAELYRTRLEISLREKQAMRRKLTEKLQQLKTRIRELEQTEPEPVTRPNVALTDDYDRYKYRSLILHGEYSKLKIEFESVASFTSRLAMCISDSNIPHAVEDLRAISQQLEGQRSNMGCVKALTNNLLDLVSTMENLKDELAEKKIESEALLRKLQNVKGQQVLETARLEAETRGKVGRRKLTQTTQENPSMAYINLHAETINEVEDLRREVRRLRELYQKSDQPSPTATLGNATPKSRSNDHSYKEKPDLAPQSSLQNSGVSSVEKSSSESKANRRRSKSPIPSLHSFGMDLNKLWSFLVPVNGPGSSLSESELNMMNFNLNEWFSDMDTPVKRKSQIPPARMEEPPISPPLPSSSMSTPSSSVSTPSSSVSTPSSSVSTPSSSVSTPTSLDEVVNQFESAQPQPTATAAWNKALELIGAL